MCVDDVASNGPCIHCWLAMSLDAMRLEKRGSKMRVDDAVGNGPGGYCSPLQSMPFDLENEGLTCVLMTWRAT